MKERICTVKIMEKEVDDFTNKIEELINIDDYPEFWGIVFRKYSLYQGIESISIGADSWEVFENCYIQLTKDNKKIDTIKVYNKKFYKFAKDIGKKFGCKELIKCWKDVL